MTKTETRTEEFSHKLTRVREWMAREGSGGVLFLSYGGFAWITCGGGNHIHIGSEAGVAGVLVTEDQAYLLADNIENRRIREEEAADLPLTPREYPWWEGSMLEEARRLTAGALACDLPLPGCRQLTGEEGIALRNPLLPSEMVRYRELGEHVGIVLTHAALHCRPGLSEHQLAGLIGKGLFDYGISPVVTLVATDERIFTRRHPLPTSRRLERYAMLVASCRRGGLSLSATRLVHFGSPPEELERKQRACAAVDAAFIHATRPGATLAEAFRIGQAAYAAEGFADEWRLHHQGGPTGYNPRDDKATPTATSLVRLHQAFAWNPSITGVKCEDTILVQEDGPEIISPTPDLPVVEVQAGGVTYQRPAILVR